MQLSINGLDLIKKSEGFRDRVYRDVAGFPTIGYGHLIKPAESFPDGIAEPQAAAILACDVQGAEQAVTRLVKVALTQGQFDALVDFCFNLGAGRLASSTLLRELNAGHHNAAAQQLLAWDHAGGVVNAGLKARRQAEFELWAGGTEENRANAKPPAEITASRPKTNAA
ncbi:MAG: lysozyme [Terracidiphilus sp.]|jgi:lysozyme